MYYQSRPCCLLHLVSNLLGFTALHFPVVHLVDHIELPADLQHSGSDEAQSGTKMGRSSKDDQSRVVSVHQGQDLPTDWESSECPKGNEHPASCKIATIVLGLA